MRPFSVKVANDEPRDLNRLVLAVSADANYVLTANPDTGALERIHIEKCRVGRAYFNTDELNWAMAFNAPAEENNH